jgi:magnesium-transporting ATPase (P-type)
MSQVPFTDGAEFAGKVYLGLAAIALLAFAVSIFVWRLASGRASQETRDKYENKGPVKNGTVAFVSTVGAPFLIMANAIRSTGTSIARQVAGNPVTSVSLIVLFAFSLFLSFGYPLMAGSVFAPAWSAGITPIREYGLFVVSLAADLVTFVAPYSNYVIRIANTLVSGCRLGRRAAGTVQGQLSVAAAARQPTARCDARLL